MAIARSNAGNRGSIMIVGCAPTACTFWLVPVYEQRMNFCQFLPAFVTANIVHFGVAADFADLQLMVKSKQ
jgi:hypothetical protein